MTEADEIADNLPRPSELTLDAARAVVRKYMPDESMVMTDNIAEALLALAERELEGCPVAPWSEERDERDPGVVLVYRDGEVKQTVRREGDYWYAVDWEIEQFQGRPVWTPRWTFSIDQRLLDAIATLKETKA